MSEMKYTMKLNRVRDLRKEGTSKLFERVKLLVEVHKDEQYREFCADSNLILEDELDGEVSDFCQSFETVRQVFEANPTEDAWQKHGFAYLAHELAESQRKPREQGISYKQKWLDALKRIEAQEQRIEALERSLQLVGGRN